nr:reverse transcriptase domain-containing protein [Tanacetum cinerariifolium]
MVEEMMVRLGDFVRSEEAFAWTELPKGETNKHPRKKRQSSTLSPSNSGSPSPVIRVLTLDALTKPPKDILATETQLRLLLPRPMLNTPRGGNIDGQRGKGNQRGEAHQPAKIINMIRTMSIKEKKRKAREVTEIWMNTPIHFPPVSSEDVSDEPIIVEVELKGYLAEIRQNTVSSPRVLNPRPSSGVRLQDTSIVEAKLSSRGSTSVAACIRLCLVCPSCLLGAACKSPSCLRLFPRGQSCLHALSTGCGPDVCDIRTSYISRQCTSSNGDNAAPCLLRRLVAPCLLRGLAIPDWLVIAF